MKKKQKNILIVSIIVLSILILGILGSTGKLPFAVSGSNTLSISQASLTSSNPYLNGKVWILTFSAGGLGQSYSGTITPSDIDSKTSDSTTTTKNLNINVVYENTECQYPIQSAGLLKPIYDIIYKEYSCFFSPSESSAKKDSGLTNILYFGKYSGLTCFVFGYNTQSIVGNLGQTNVNAPFTINLEVDGKNAIKRIDTLTGSNQGAIGDYAYAIWGGNLVSGVSCPQTTNNLYVPIYVNGNWRLGSKQSYDTYVSLINNAPTTSKDSNTILYNNLKKAISNAKVSRSFGSIESSSSLSNAIIKYTTASAIQFPVTTLYIKADTLGIFTPTPDIRPTSASSNCFKTGDTGLISVNIKNYGESGTFNVYATCLSPFSTTQTITGSLNKDEVRTINIPLSASASEKTSKSCTVFIESGGTTKQINSNVCVDPHITCLVAYPTKFCGILNNQEVVQQCSSDGFSTKTIETCDSTKYCDKGECKLKGSTESSLGIWDSIKGFFSGLSILLTIVKWILLVIGSLFSFLFGKQLLDKIIKKKDKTNKIVIWTLSILLGLGIAVLLYAILMTWIFWAVIIGLIVFNIIIKLVIPRF